MDPLDRHQHELTTFDLLCTIIDSHTVFYDCGSSFGYYTIPASMKIKKSGEVHAFDADPRAIQLLKSNKQLNNTSFKINNIALSDTSGEEIALTSEPTQSIVSSTGEDIYKPQVCNTIDQQRSYEVGTTTLDSYVNNNRAPDILKIDVEDFEYSTLSGATSILEEQVPELVLVEIHTDRIRNFDAEPSDVVELLTSFGYHCYLFQRHEGLNRKGSPLLEATVQEGSLNIVHDKNVSSELTSSTVTELPYQGAFQILCSYKPLTTDCEVVTQLRKMVRDDDSVQ